MTTIDAPAPIQSIQTTSSVNPAATPIPIISIKPTQPQKATTASPDQAEILFLACFQIEFENQMRIFIESRLNQMDQPKSVATNVTAAVNPMAHPVSSAPVAVAPKGSAPIDTSKVIVSTPIVQPQVNNQLKDAPNATAKPPPPGPSPDIPIPAVTTIATKPIFPPPIKKVNPALKVVEAVKIDSGNPAAAKALLQD